MHVIDTDIKLSFSQRQEIPLFLCSILSTWKPNRNWNFLYCVDHSIIILVRTLQNACTLLVQSNHVISIYCLQGCGSKILIIEKDLWSGSTDSQHVSSCHFQVYNIRPTISFLAHTPAFDTIVTSHYLILKHREMHGCMVSTEDTDALVLKHQAISIHNAD